MALLSDYTSGTVSITDGTTALVGTGTAWKTAGFAEGDTFLKNNRSAVIASVNSDTSITLAENWDGGTLSDATYRMRFQPSQSRLTAKAQALYELLGSGNNQALAGLTGAANKVPVFTGAGTMAAVTAAALQGMAAGVIGKSVDYTVTADDGSKLIAVSAASGARTITLPSAATVGSGFSLGVKKTDTSANTVTIAAAGGDTIDGEASAVLAARHDVVWLRSDGTNWQVVGERVSVAKGVRYDAFVETDAGLDDYDDKPGPTETAPGFSVLVADYDDSGRAAIVSKLSDDSGDWSDPAYLAPAIDITADPVDVVDFGTDPSASLTADGAGGYTLSLSLPKSADLVGVTVTTLNPGEDATASLTPAEGGYTLALGLPKGDTGTISGLTALWQNIVTEKTDAEASREALGLEIGTDVQGYDAQLAALAGLTGAAGSFVRWTDADTAVMQAILGTVSQSSGVPTGAIIERGSNSNGDYVRFADGTQICTIQNATFDYSSGANMVFAWTYPAAFSVGPSAWITSFSSSSLDYDGALPFSNAPLLLGVPDAASATLYLRGSSNWASGQQFRNVKLVAIGRWF